MIEVGKVHKGDRVRFEGQEGIVLLVDHDEYDIEIDFAPDDSAVDGRITLSVDEPGLELLPGEER
jgi:hypothetical protein